MSGSGDGGTCLEDAVDEAGVAEVPESVRRADPQPPELRLEEHATLNQLLQTVFLAWEREGRRIAPLRSHPRREEHARDSRPQRPRKGGICGGRRKGLRPAKKGPAERRSMGRRGWGGRREEKKGGGGEGRRRKRRGGEEEVSETG